jgi:hypothetical protein
VKSATSVRERLVFYAVRVHVRKVLRARSADREAEDAKIREIEAAGGRIVDGGQLDNQAWEITDWRTGMRLAHGDGGLDGFAEARAVRHGRRAAEPSRGSAGLGRRPVRTRGGDRRGGRPTHLANAVLTVFGAASEDTLRLVGDAIIDDPKRGPRGVQAGAAWVAQANAAAIESSPKTAAWTRCSRRSKSTGPWTHESEAW